MVGDLAAAVDVDDVMAFVGRLERAMVGALGEEGIADARGRAQDGRDFTGVWVGEAKLGSIGLHISHGVTMHGLSLNVDDAALEPFGWIVPCGLGGVAMTSVQALTGRAGRLDCVRKRVAHHLARELDARQRLVTPQRLERALTATPVG